MFDAINNVLYWQFFVRMGLAATIQGGQGVCTSTFTMKVYR